ncbi:MAG: hypothetical protein GF384_04390, partial [Elusimicrobia bacterium]|nr:hypothetical protein [Elusimicrobiota bacterium]
MSALICVICIINISAQQKPAINLTYTISDEPPSMIQREQVEELEKLLKKSLTSF